MINLLVEVSPVDANGSTVVLRIASQNATKDGLQFGDGHRWLPLIRKQPARDISWSSEGEVQETSISWEPVVFNMAAVFGNDDWPNLYNFQGAPCRMWRGNMGDPFSSYTKIYEGTAGAVSRKGLTGELPLLGTDFALDRYILTRAYAGTDAAGGMEGQSSLRGILKPFAAGDCLNVEPVKVDPINLIFQYHGYGPTKAVDAVYENALTLGPPSAVASTFAELKALNLKQGQWATAPALGAFRLGAQPVGKITADVRGALASDGRYPTTVGGVMTLIIQRVGQSASTIASSLANRSEAWPIYLNDQSTVAEELRKALLGCGCASVPTADGQFAAVDYFDLGAPLVLDASQSNGPIIRDYSQLAVAPPVYRVVVSGERCWSVHSEQEISQAVAIISADAEAAAAAAEAARDQAAQAQADADVQKRRIDEILADGLLTRDEKAQQIARYDSESAQFDELYTRASAFDIADERSVLAATWNALTSYLNDLSPGFRNLDESTPIDGRYDTNWREYELAKIILLRAMSGSAATTAAWGGVAGRPTTLAQLDADAGTKLDETKTAADEAVKNANEAKDNANGIRTQLPDLVGPLLQVPIDNLSALHLTGSTAIVKASKALADKNAVAITELGTRIDESGAVVAEQITQLTSRVEKGEGTAEAGFLEVNRTIADTKQALAEQVVSTIAKYGESASAGMVEERRVRAEGDRLLTETIDQMAVDLTNSFGDAITGQINDVKKIIADNEGATGIRIDELGVSFETGIEGEKVAREAAIKTVEKAIVDANGATSGRVDTLSSFFDALNKYVGDVATGVGNVDERVNAVYSVIQTNQETAANANEARAQETRDLTARLDNMNYAQLQESFSTYASKVDGIGAEYTLKVQTTQNGEKFIAGMGIAIENGVSAINFLADSFRITANGQSGPQQVFYSDAQGVYMPNVRVDKLVPGAIDFEFVNKQSLLDPSGGYQMLPGGMIMQWGRFRQVIRNELTFSVNFPIPFPNVCLSFSATPYLNVFNNERDLWIQIIGQPTTSGAVVATQAARRDDQYLDGFDWFAIGR